MSMTTKINCSRSMDGTKLTPVFDYGVLIYDEATVVALREMIFYNLKDGTMSILDSASFDARPKLGPAIPAPVC